MAAQPKFNVVGILHDNAERTQFTRVPGMTWTVAEVRAGLLGGVNGSGVKVAGGWHNVECATCGESGEWCPDIVKVLSTKPEGRAWIDAKRSA
jgi:hypothetical protein